MKKIIQKNKKLKNKRGDFPKILFRYFEKIYNKDKDTWSRIHFTTN